ncbi:MAG: hypothetical protein ABEK00_03155 [Candidatus Nanohaloarchaea archaeon]
MTDLDKLEVDEVSSFVTSSVEEFKQKVKNTEVSKKDLEALKSAEKSGKNRSKVIEFIDSQIEKIEISEDLDIAEKDLEGIQGLLDDVAELEETDISGEERSDIEQDRLIELVGGTVDDIKSFVRDENPSVEVLDLLLKSEKKVKDRKTAKSFINKRIEKKKVENDLEKTRSDIESLERDIESVEKDTGSEDGEETSEDESSSGGQDSDEETEEEEVSQEEIENDEDKDRDEEANESEKSEESSDLDRKKEIAESLEVDYSGEELKEIPLEELETIKEEKEERSELITRLEDEGLDSEKLQKASTSDLRKVAEEALDQSDSSNAESEKSEEEIREEAEEDLQMLMGAVKEDEEEEESESSSPRERIDNLKERISSAIDRSSDEGMEESEGMNDSDVKEVLDNYSDLENDEAVIKTAHVIKGYLETELGIQRELTYKELSEELPSEPEEMKKLAEFFEKMHKEQYTQNIDIKAGAIIETCKSVVDEL